MLLPPHYHSFCVPVSLPFKRSIFRSPPRPNDSSIYFPCHRLIFRRADRPCYSLGRLGRYGKGDYCTTCALKVERERRVRRERVGREREEMEMEDEREVEDDVGCHEEDDEEDGEDGEQ